MRPSLLQLLAAAVTVDIAAGLAISDNLVVHEKRDAATGAHLTKRGRVDGSLKIPVRVGLKSNPDAEAKAEQWLMDVSDPNSKNYGRHWSHDQVIKAFQPTDETAHSVKKWLTSVIGEHRITHTDNKAWFAFDATAEELEKLTRAEYYEHHDTETGNVLLATDEYSIPQSLKDHIDFINPGVNGVKVKSRDLKKRSHANRLYAAASDPPASYGHEDLSNCDKSVTPACIRALYGFKAQDPHAKVNKNNAIGIFESGDTYNQEDLNLFYKNYTNYIPQGHGPILNAIDGAHAPETNISRAGGESDLDFELAIPIIYPQNVVLYQTDDDYYVSINGDGSGDFNTFLDAIDGSYCTYEGGNDKIDPVYPDTHDGGYKGKLMCGTYKATNVISVSYGDQENNFHPFYLQRQCREFLKLGLQGTSVFFSSGDSGVGGPKNCLGTDNKVFNPQTVANCPWVTAVGATKIAPGNTVHDPEIVANDPAGHPYRSAYSSGGGFSNLFPRPWYQELAVNHYLKKHTPPYPSYRHGNYTSGDKGVYNRDGRGYPDVSAVGDAIAVFSGGRYHGSGGTSASSPIFASLINRIVEERLANGKGPVGFINPVLYFFPDTLNDITNGSNPNCGTDGFSAAQGWDPVSGLGTPKYKSLSKLFNWLP